MKKIAALTMVLALALSLLASASACTGFYVGKDLSADGTPLFGRTEDIGSGYNKCFNVNPATEGEGEVSFTDPYNGFTMNLPAAGCQWTMINDPEEMDDGQYAEAVMNAYGVSMTATVSIHQNEKVDEFDPMVENGLREAYIPYVVMPYVQTAREAVERLGAIVEEFGSAEGNTVLIGDTNEVWYMEIVSGHQWAAVKAPDDCYAVIPNCSMLGYIDVNDTEHVLCSEGIYSMPEENGFLAFYNEKPWISLTYGEELADGNRARAWGGQHYFSESQNIPYDSEVFELFLKSDEKISLANLMNAMAYRYEGTEYDCNVNPSVRAIGTIAQAECHIFQYVDDVLIQWQCMGNAEGGIFLPIYNGITETPAAFQVTGDAYSFDSAYWTFRTLQYLAQTDRVNYGAAVESFCNAYQEKLIANAAEATAAIAAMSDEEAAAFATEQFAKVSEEALGMTKEATAQLLYYMTNRGEVTSTPRYELTLDVEG